MDGRGKGPKPYSQKRASTCFLRVPRGDWAAVRDGRKREFRSGVGKNISQMWSVSPPCPVVCYAVTRGSGYESALMVLEALWQEPLGAITPESLDREGFKSFAEFRRYFTLREKRHFTPTRIVQAYRVRPWQPPDADRMADLILRRLYGDWLDEDGDAQESPRDVLRAREG